MVKILFAILLTFSLSFSQENEPSQENLVIQKIKMLIDSKVYNENKAFINIIFSKYEDYTQEGVVDSVKIVETLKENGLLNLFYKKPHSLTLSFKTSGSPLFFIKIMGDTLRNIGYYRYVTKESNLNSSEFVWTINFTSEYATDPLILQKELRKSGCNITDIRRDSPYEWVYTVDMRDGHLNIATIDEAQELKIKRSLYPYWLDVSKIQKLRVKTSRRSSWYPYVAYYDSSLHLLKVVKVDRKSSKVTFKLPVGTHYMKISDIYTLKNIKDSLVVVSIGSR